MADKEKTIIVNGQQKTVTADELWHPAPFSPSISSTPARKHSEELRCPFR
jgi:hypothetical protein